MRQKKYYRPLLIIASVLFLGCCVVVLLAIAFYIDQIVMPLSPISSGSIPENWIWVYQTDDTIVSTPVIQGSSIFLRSPNTLFAIDADTRDLLWKSNSNTPSRVYSDDLSPAPIIGNDLLITPEDNGSIAAYNKSNGQLFWKTPEIDINRKYSTIANIESFTIVDDKVFVARRRKSLSAYDLVTGYPLWEAPITELFSLQIVADERCVYLRIGKALQCYDPSTGDMLWGKSFDAFIGPIKLDSGILYMVLMHVPASLTAIDLDSLQPIWSTALNSTPNEDFQSIAVDGERLYVAGERLHTISRKGGDILWESSNIGLLEQPLPFGTKVIVRSTGKDLFLFDAQTGQELGHLELKVNTPLKQDPDRSPAVLGNLLIIPFGDNRLYAYLLEP